MIQSTSLTPDLQLTVVAPTIFLDDFDPDAFRHGVLDFDFTAADLEPPDFDGLDLPGYQHDGPTPVEALTDGTDFGEPIGGSYALVCMDPRSPHNGRVYCGLVFPTAADAHAWVAETSDTVRRDLVDGGYRVQPVDLSADVRRGRPVDPERDWAEDEILASRSNGGHHYGPDAEGGAL